ncbi:type II toxin-antitoxin system HicA family toxin [Trebonia sp.]|uniref:type II toxin-antitoxin system HicA family toxin n=1 Tax=Trebonia sp. TaxID=2767075 RepID=UPI0026309F56|nr:type II toxin-antitoxin system HicA family toxin [Trebonia sp.]
MPSSIPDVPGAKVVKALQGAGFAVVRINGSHHVMQHPDGRTVPVPVHAGRNTPKGTLRNILAIVGMTPDEFRALL